LKRLTKLAVSTGFFLATFAKDTILGFFGKKRPGTCVILYYHSVRREHRAQFARQMDALLRFVTPVPADRCQPLSPATRYASVTFDDGFVSVVENAVPALVDRQIPATLFVLADLLGTTPIWPTYGEGYRADERIASAEELRDLPSDLITIGSHTMSHPVLTSLSEMEAKTELMASRKKLTALFGRDIQLFSFPYGALNDSLVSWCREAGYRRVFSILPTQALDDPNEYLSGRVAVEPTDWPLEFRLKLLGAYRWLPRVFEWKKTLVSRARSGTPTASHLA
jgi:peptidoglycan/xylan/chitin deacetylase (PgdA/CDA1 family)